ncbi:hypothetical protein [Gemmatimonas sp.]|uniref:hypothetical protein n=1 Tax=Gemmatimonas sp. TaxID=1962908 RepID=UPI003DA23288
MFLLHLVFATMHRTAPLPQVKDSTSVALRPVSVTDVGMTWVALDSARHVVNQGGTPSTVKMPPFGSTLTYCVDRGAGHLELVVQNPQSRITATARCTKVTVRGLAIRTESVRDPRAVRER